MTTKLIATSACPSSAGGQNDKDFLALIDAYAEARHVGGCHTYNAKTAEARAKVVAQVVAPTNPAQASAAESNTTGAALTQGAAIATVAVYAELPNDVIDYVKGSYAFLQSTAPDGYAEEVFRLPPSATRNQRSLQDALQSDKRGWHPAAARQDSGDGKRSGPDAGVSASHGQAPAGAETERSDALCDSSYIAGAKAGFNLGVAHDYDALSRLVEGRHGYLQVLAATRPQATPSPKAAQQAPNHVLHLVQDAFAEVAMAHPKAFDLHKVGIADTAVRKALAAQQAPAGVGEVPGPVRLRFFRDMTEDQRLLVFKVFGVLPEGAESEAGTHSVQHLLLKAMYRQFAAPAAPSTPASGGVTVGPVGLEWLITEINKLPAVRAAEFDGEESDGTPKHWRDRPHVSLRKLERLLREFFAPPPVDAAPASPTIEGESK